MNGTDIIIPIYNALDCLKECLQSILKNTDLVQNRLILIDDKSPDENVVSFLRDFAAQHQDLNIIVLYNEKNLGFVGTVNKGMRYSNRDILLLNSDTEVPAHWLERIQICAYSDKTIGTVTALSNNATLVSVPVGLQPNNIPDHLSLEEYAQIVYEASYNDYIDLPTSHGFCMFIKREVLNLIGFFDEDNFGKGYGEENDFSFRCMDFGYRNVLCDNVYILHKESQSFKADKQKLLEHNLAVLNDRYPAYRKKIDLWLQQFPLKKTCENLIYNLNVRKKENILFLIHDFTDPYHNVGGTTIHCMDLIKSLRKKYNIHVLFPENDIYKIHSFFEEDEKILNLGGVNANSRFEYYNREYREIVERIIKGLNIAVVHVHHMMGHYFDIIDVCKDSKVKSIITLHDFYALCPTVNMLYNMEQCCLYLDKKDCKTCLNNKMRLVNNILPIWKKRWIDFLENFDYVITPSKSTKNIIEKEYNSIMCHVIEHGVSYKKQMSILDNMRETFNVAFVGVMAKHKGAEVVEKLIEKTSDKNIVYHLFGKTEYVSLEKNRDNYVNHGQYKREELSYLLKENNIQLICNLSIWPETYSYTLTETIASGVPVLALDYGAVAERIEKYQFGWILDRKASFDDIINQIYRIRNDKKDYQNKINNINQYHIKTIDEMVVEYDKLYEIKEMNPINHEELRKLIDFSCRDMIIGNSAQLEEILNSRRWKIVSRIELPDFMKKALKKIVK